MESIGIYLLALVLIIGGGVGGYKMMNYGREVKLKDQRMSMEQRTESRI